MDRRRAAGALLALAVCVASSAAAPTASNETALDIYDGPSEGCYYNFQSYGEGDRIMTNEPCLNCTCHNRMLMCYLRVCPFTKPIGQDCTVEKRADQCCPIVTCPDVPVDLLTSTSTSSPAEYGGTGLGRVDKYGCEINGKYFPEGAKVPPSPNKPCEHCYCIRNMTTCVMQECTLHVEGCTPIYNKDVCCPVRYSCDHPEDEIPMLDDMTTTVRPTPGFLLTTTTVASVTQTSQACVHNDEVFADGALIKTEKACEHCYCMKGDIVCVVQECGTPMENEGKNCTSIPPREGQCCPDTYICEGDDLSTELVHELTTIAYQEEETTSPPRRVGVEGSGYRNEDEVSYTEVPVFETDSEGSGDEPAIETITKAHLPEKEPELIDEGFMMTDMPHKFSPVPTEQVTVHDEPKVTTEPDKGLNTVPDVISEEEHTESPLTKKPLAVDHKEHEYPETTTANVALSLDEEREKTESPRTEQPEEVYEKITEVVTPAQASSPTPSSEELVTKMDSTMQPEAPKITTVRSEAVTELPKLTTEADTITAEPELATTYKTKDTTSPSVVEITTINVVENEIDEDSTAYPPPGRIPGEGDCLLDGVTYRNESAVLSQNKCHSSCKCISSIIKCEPIICSPPLPDMENCQSIYDSPEACCPTYVCVPSKETVPPQSHNQMSGTESPLPPPKECKDNECGITVKEPCVSGDCDESQIAVTPDFAECGSEGCTLNKPISSKAPQESDVPCIGENCAVPSFEEKPEIMPSTPCEGSTCGGTIDSKEDIDKCDGKEGCKLPEKDVIAEECSGVDCRRTGTEQEAENKLPAECSGAECSPQNIHTELVNKPDQVTEASVELSTDKQGTSIPVETSDKTQEDKMGTSDSATDKHSEIVTQEPQSESSLANTQVTSKDVNEEHATTDAMELTTKGLITDGEATTPTILREETKRPVEEITQAVEVTSEILIESTTKQPIQELSQEITPSTTLLETTGYISKDETSKLPEIAETQKAQEVTTETIVAKPQENEIQTDLLTTGRPIEVTTIMTQDLDQEIVDKFSEAPTECDGGLCIEKSTTSPSIEQEKCDPNEGCKLPEISDDTQEKSTELPSKCNTGECEITPETTLEEKDTCTTSEGCKLPETTGIKDDVSTEKTTHCQGLECETIGPVQPVIPEDKCDDSENCKTPQDTKTETSCSNDDCTPEDIPLENKDITTPRLELDLTTKQIPIDFTTKTPQEKVEEDMKDVTSTGVDTSVPFTNAPNESSESPIPDVLSSVSPTSDERFTSGVTNVVDLETKGPSEESTTKSYVGTELQYTTDINVLSETVQPAQQSESETDKIDVDASFATTTSSDISASEKSSSEKPDYHDTEPEKVTTSLPTEPPFSKTTQHVITESSDLGNDELTTVTPKEQSTEKDQSISEISIPTTGKVSEEQEPESSSEATKFTTTTELSSLDEPSKQSGDKESQAMPEKPEPETSTSLAITEQSQEVSETSTVAYSKKPLDVTEPSDIITPMPVTIATELQSQTTIAPLTEETSEAILGTVPQTYQTDITTTEKASEFDQIAVITESTTKAASSVSEENAETVEKLAETITKSPEIEKQSEVPPKVRVPDEKIDETPTETSALGTSASSVAPTENEAITQAPQGEGQSLITDAYPQESEQDHKLPKPIATESQVLMTEPSKLPEIQPTEHQEVPTITQESTTPKEFISDKESSATTLASESIDKEFSATTVPSESIDKESNVTPMTSDSGEKDTTVTMITAEPVEIETKLTTIGSRPDVKESSATTFASEPADKDLKTTTPRPVVADKEISVTTAGLEYTDKELSVTTTGPELVDKDVISTTAGPVLAETEPSSTTLASKPIEKEASATTVSFESIDKESNVTPTTPDIHEKETSATTEASLSGDKEPSVTTKVSESEPSAVTTAVELSENELEKETVSAESAEVKPTPTVEKEPSVTTAVPEIIEKETISTSAVPELVESESGATTMIPERLNKEPNPTTIASLPSETEISSTVASEITDEKQIMTTILPRLPEKQPSVTTVASEPTDIKPSAPTVESEMVDKEPSITTIEPKPEINVPVTVTSETIEKEPSVTTLASEHAEKEPSETTLASEPLDKKSSTTTMGSNIVEDESASITTVPSETKYEEPEETSATTLASEISEKEPSSSTMTSLPLEKEPSKTSSVSETLDFEPSATTKKPELNEKDTSVTTVSAQPVEKESSITTVASEFVELEPSLTTMATEIKDKESSSMTTLVAEIQTEISAPTTPVIKEISEEISPQTEAPVVYEKPEFTTQSQEVSSETAIASETTPDQVELELHTHKAPEEMLTIVPSDNEYSTLSPEFASSEKTSETTAQDETSTDDGRKTLAPEQTTAKAAEEPVKQTSEEQKLTETTATSAIDTTLAPTDVIKETDIRFGDDQTSTISSVSATTLLEEEKIATTTEKTISEKPESPAISETITTHQPSGISDEEFIPVTTTKVVTTTEKVEEEPMQTTPAVEKFTKTEEKPAEVTESPELPKPVDMPTDEVPPPEEFPPSGGYGQEPDYVEEDQSFGPGTCRYGGKVYVSAQQIPRDDPCDFCFCFRSDIICLQQSCPPPIHGCHEEPISGFCCPRYECPVSMATTLNVTTTTTTTTTTLPPHFFPHAYKGAAQRRGCVIKGQTYKVGDVVRASSGPCLHCTCGGDGQMKCDPKACTPEPMLRQMIAAAVSARRR